MRRAVVLTIAGSDSSGGAGIEADLKTMCALGVYGTVALTSVTAQNTLGVTDSADLSPSLVAAQIDAVAEDLDIDAAKTGMLSNARIIEAVAGAVERNGLRRLVVDPVMVATSGAALIEDDAVGVLRERLMPLAMLVTPNVPEAAVLSGVDVTGRDTMEAAARAIHEAGAAAVLIKGGHLEGDATDLLYDGASSVWLTSPRISAGQVHGTGCTLSAAVACWLALGRGLGESVRLAKEYVTRGIEARLSMGHGSALVDHMAAAPEEDR